MAEMSYSVATRETVLTISGSKNGVTHFTELHRTLHRYFLIWY